MEVRVNLVNCDTGMEYSCHVEMNANNQIKSVALVNGTHLCLLHHPEKLRTQLSNKSDRDDITNKNDRNRMEKDRLVIGAQAQAAVLALSIRSVPKILEQRLVITRNCVNGERKYSSSSASSSRNESVRSTDSDDGLSADEKETDTDIDSFILNNDSIWKEVFIDYQTLQQYFKSGSVVTPQNDLIQCPIDKNVAEKIQQPATDDTSASLLTVVHADDKGCIFLQINSTGNQNRTNGSADFDCDYTLLDKKEREILRVKNGKSGFIVADFFGVNAFEQVMFLSPMNKNNDPSRNSKQSNSESHSIDRNSGKQTMNNIIHQKRALIEILMHCVITNGSEIYFHNSQKEANTHENSIVDRTITAPLITIPIEPGNLKRYFSSSNNSKVYDESKVKQSNKRKIHETTCSFPSLLINPVKNQMNQDEEERTIDCWKDKIKHGLQQRLKYELEQKRKQSDISLIRQQVLKQNRLILRKISLERLGERNEIRSKCNNRVGDNILEIVRIRHDAQFNKNDFSLNHPNCLGVKLHLEIDFLLQNKKNKRPKTFSSDNEMMNGYNQLFDLQLACSQNYSYKGLDNIVLKTHSGIAPCLRVGECITIVAAVFVSGIKLTSGLATPIRFTLNAYYFTRPFKDVLSSMAIKGIEVGSIIIPIESLLLHQNFINIKSTSHLDNFYDFVPLYEDKSLSNTKSQAIYEYRKPRILTIDVSHDVGADLVKKWKTEIEKINEKISCESHIYVDYEEETMQLKVTVISASPEHRAIIIELILQYLPKNSKIVESSTESMKGSSITKSVLAATNREIRLLETHMEGAKLSFTEMNEISLAQRQTDELSAKIINLLKH